MELQAPLPVQVQLVDAQSMFNLRNLLAHGRPDPRGAGRVRRVVCRAGAGPGHLRIRSGPHPGAPARRRYAGAGALPRESLIEQALAGADPVALQALARRTVVLPAQTLVNANTCDLSVLQAVTPAVEPARLQALLVSATPATGCSTAVTSPTDSN